jgi:hypothetical protein
LLFKFQDRSKVNLNSNCLSFALNLKWNFFALINLRPVASWQWDFLSKMSASLFDLKCCFVDVSNQQPWLTLSNPHLRVTNYFNRFSQMPQSNWTLRQVLEYELSNWSEISLSSPTKDFSLNFSRMKNFHMMENWHNVDSFPNAHRSLFTKSETYWEIKNNLFCG